MTEQTTPKCYHCGSDTVDGFRTCPSCLAPIELCTAGILRAIRHWCREVNERKDLHREDVREELRALSLDKDVIALAWGDPEARPTKSNALGVLRRSVALAKACGANWNEIAKVFNEAMAVNNSNPSEAEKENAERLQEEGLLPDDEGMLDAFVETSAGELWKVLEEQADSVEETRSVVSGEIKRRAVESPATVVECAEDVRDEIRSMGIGPGEQYLFSVKHYQANTAALVRRMGVVRQAYKESLVHRDASWTLPAKNLHTIETLCGVTDLVVEALSQNLKGMVHMIRASDELFGETKRLTLSVDEMSIRQAKRQEALRRLADEHGDMLEMDFASGRPHKRDERRVEQFMEAGGMSEIDRLAGQPVDHREPPRDKVCEVCSGAKWLASSSGAIVCRHCAEAGVITEKSE